MLVTTGVISQQWGLRNMEYGVCWSWEFTSLQCHFVRSHICSVHVCLAVTCHLHFWQNDWGLLHASAVPQGWNKNQSWHKKLTPEKIILLLLLLLGLEPETFWSLLPCFTTELPPLTCSTRYCSRITHQSTLQPGKLCTIRHSLSQHTATSSSSRSPHPAPDCLSHPPRCVPADSQILEHQSWCVWSERAGGCMTAGNGGRYKALMKEPWTVPGWQPEVGEEKKEKQRKRKYSWSKITVTQTDKVWNSVLKAIIDAMLNCYWSGEKPTKTLWTN